MSRRHCEVRRVGDAFELHDLGSSHGSFVNTLPVGRYVLLHTDFVQIGSTALVFLRDASSGSHPPGDGGSLVARSTVERRPEEIAELLRGGGREASELRVLLDVATAVQESHDAEPLAGRLLDLVFAALAAERGGVLLSSPESDAPTLVAERGREAGRSAGGEQHRLRSAGTEHGLVGESPAMARLARFLARVAPVGSTVLLRGESGTGKELAARALHRGSPRADGPFVAINGATLSETLLESELFGHERGAFTGAVARKIGKLEAAHEGTLFLDEVGEIPVALQARLLRALQERRFERLGGPSRSPSSRAAGGKSTGGSSRRRASAKLETTTAISSRGARSSAHDAVAPSRAKSAPRPTPTVGERGASFAGSGRAGDGSTTCRRPVETIDMALRLWHRPRPTEVATQARRAWLRSPAGCGLSSTRASHGRTKPKERPMKTKTHLKAGPEIVVGGGG